MSKVECMVMGLIGQGYRYGHEIDRVVAERQMRLWSKMTRASLYQALTRVEGKGWVVGSVGRNGKFPERTVYELTDAGKVALEGMIAEGLDSDGIVELDVCVFVSFLYLLPSHEALRHLKKRKAAKVKLLSTLPERTDEDDTPFGRRFNTRLIRGYYELEVKWLDEMMSELCGESQEGSHS